MGNFDRRLAVVEQRLKPPSAHRLVVIVRGGLHNGDPTFATAGAMTWERLSGEMFAEFRARVIGDPVGAGQHFVIIGGLPREV
jgi:hypothetical protein